MYTTLGLKESPLLEKARVIGDGLIACTTFRGRRRSSPRVGRLLQSLRLPRLRSRV
jgi:hypothetical protein